MHFDLKFYVFQGDEYTKIGISANTYLRLMSINSGGVPFDVAPLFIATGPEHQIRWLEQRLLASLPGHIKGEWFLTSANRTEELRKSILQAARGRAIQFWEGMEALQLMAAEVGARRERDQQLARRWHRDESLDDLYKSLQ